MPCAVAICASLSTHATCTGHERLPLRRGGPSARKNASACGLARRRRRADKRVGVGPPRGVKKVLPTTPDLVRAIGEKRLIEFVYKDRRMRVVEPHDYGIRSGAEKLLAFQISGESRSGASHGWKWFDVVRMGHLVLLERRFPGSRADSGQQHHTWDTLFARVT
jgi:hypothetical protein